MSVTENFPRKKRRLFLNPKTPPYLDGHPHDISVCVKEISQSLKSQLIRSPILTNSSDESSLEIGEIGWDNNSLSPASICTAKVRKTKKGKAADIHNILKKVSKKKRHDIENTHEDDEDVESFSAWMQNNLAKNANKENTILTMRPSKRKAQKKGASSFNEELKRFMQQMIPKTHNLTQNNESNSIAANTNSTQNADVDNLSDIILKDLECSVIEVKNPIPYQLSITPKLRRNVHRKTTPDHENIFMKKPRNRKTPKSFKKPFKKSIPNDKPLKVEHFDNKVKSPVKPLIDDVDFDDELDQILTQEVFDSDNNTCRVTSNCINEKDTGSKKNLDFTKIKTYEKSSDIHLNSDKKFKEERAKNSTPNSKFQNELFDIDDMFSEDILNDIETEFRCKSQDTPPVVSPAMTEEQRKLRKRSHTSPFPVSKQRLKKPAYEVASTSNNQTIGKADNNDLLLKETCSTKSYLENKKNINTTNSLPKYKATNACQKQFKPPFNRGSTINSTMNSSRAHLGTRIYSNRDKIFELSCVGLPSERKVEDDSDLVADIRKANDVQLSSTQRCSYEEIERKRKEAQLRLREKLKKH